MKDVVAPLHAEKTERLHSGGENLSFTDILQNTWGAAASINSLNGNSEICASSQKQLTSLADQAYVNEGILPSASNLLADLVASGSTSQNTKNFSQMSDVAEVHGGRNIIHLEPSATGLPPVTDNPTGANVTLGKDGTSIQTSTKPNESKAHVPVMQNWTNPQLQQHTLDTDIEWTGTDPRLKPKTTDAQPPHIPELRATAKRLPGTGSDAEGEIIHPPAYYKNTHTPY